MDKVYQIYGLFDPRNNELKYIGYTSVPLNRRLLNHLYELKTKRSKNYRKFEWFQELLDLSLKPDIKTIEIIDKKDWSEKEKYWISRYNNLLNITPGGDSGPSWVGKKHSEETKNRMSQKSKGHHRNKGIKRSKEFCDKLGKNKIGNKNRVGLYNSLRHRLILLKANLPFSFEKHYELFERIRSKKNKEPNWKIAEDFNIWTTTFYGIKRRGLEYYKNLEKQLKENELL